VNRIDESVFDTKSQAEYDLAAMKARIQMELIKAEQERGEIFRREVGLTHLEQDAHVIFSKLQQAVIELAFYHKMDKNKFVIDKAALKVANTRIMYDSLCKKIFKLCLKHGLKSEHLK